MISLKVPPLGASIVEATVSRWVKNQGDSVSAGDTVLELDTDKITVEVPSLRAGVLTKQSVKEGDIVPVDDILGEIDETATAGAPAATTRRSAFLGRPFAGAFSDLWKPRGRNADSRSARSKVDSNRPKATA